MKYRTAQLRKAWNAAAKQEHRICCDQQELHTICKTEHWSKGRRYIEMQAFEAKNGTTQTFEF